MHAQTHKLTPMYFIGTSQRFTKDPKKMQGRELRISTCQPMFFLFELLSLVLLTIDLLRVKTKLPLSSVFYIIEPYHG